MEILRERIDQRVKKAMEILEAEIVKEPGGEAICTVWADGTGTGLATGSKFSMEEQRIIADEVLPAIFRAGEKIEEMKRRRAPKANPLVEESFPISEGLCGPLHVNALAKLMSPDPGIADIRAAVRQLEAAIGVSLPRSVSGVVKDANLAPAGDVVTDIVRASYSSCGLPFEIAADSTEATKLIAAFHVQDKDPKRRKDKRNS